MSSNSRNNLPAAGGAGAAAGGAGAAAGASSGMTADRKIKEFQDYLTANGLTVDEQQKGIFTVLTIKKGDSEVALIRYTDYKEPPAKSFFGNMEAFEKPTIYVDQVTRLDNAYKGIGKLLMQYVAALAAKQHKTFGFTAISDRGNTEKLVRYYNSIGANKVNKRFDKPWGFTQRQLARRGVLYKTNDPLKIVSSGGGGKTRKRQHRKRKQTRRT
jgi:hypothetical protein